MSKHGASSSTAAPPTTERTYFEQQRDILLKEIGVSFEHVLANMNKLNRSLEAVTAVGNEFASVEALWSQFENVMGKDPETVGGNNGKCEGSTQGDADEEDSRISRDDTIEDETAVLDARGGRR